METPASTSWASCSYKEHPSCSASSVHGILRVTMDHRCLCIFEWLWGELSFLCFAFHMAWAVACEWVTWLNYADDHAVLQLLRGLFPITTSSLVGKQWSRNPFKYLKGYKQRFTWVVSEWLKLQVVIFFFFGLYICIFSHLQFIRKKNTYFERNYPLCV